MVRRNILFCSDGSSAQLQSLTVEISRAYFCTFLFFILIWLMLNRHPRIKVNLKSLGTSAIWKPLILKRHVYSKKQIYMIRKVCFQGPVWQKLSMGSTLMVLMRSIWAWKRYSFTAQSRQQAHAQIQFQGNVPKNYIIKFAFVLITIACVRWNDVQSTKIWEVKLCSKLSNVPFSKKENNSVLLTATCIYNVGVHLWNVLENILLW